MNTPFTVRRNYPEEPTTPNTQLHTDLRRLLDHMDGEYVSGELAIVLRRLRERVGYGQ